MSADRVDTIKRLLEKALSPRRLEISDDSRLHAGHAGARSGRGHFSVTVVADAFIGRTLLERHRMVYDALRETLETDIHALSIKAYTPDEVHSRH